MDFLSGRQAVSLTTEGGEGAAEVLVGEGVARIASKEAKRVKRRAAGDKDFDLLARLEAAQAGARKARVNMWQWGDIGESEDDERKPGPPLRR